MAGSQPGLAYLEREEECCQELQVIAHKRMNGLAVGLDEFAVFLRGERLPVQHW